MNWAQQPFEFLQHCDLFFKKIYSHLSPFKHILQHLQQVNTDKSHASVKVGQGHGCAFFFFVVLQSVFRVKMFFLVEYSNLVADRSHAAGCEKQKHHNNGRKVLFLASEATTFATLS